MIASTTTTDMTWRLLWSHTARHIVNDLSIYPELELVSAGYGWGLRRNDDHRCALLVHPTGSDRDAGDLSLTILGQGTHVIPRADSSFHDYFGLVADAVETAARFYLNSPVTQ